MPCSRAALLLGVSAVFLSCAACGSEKPDLDSLCDDAPPPSAYSGALVTSAACPFEQQTDNILQFGTEVSARGLILHAAGSATGALVTNQCGDWLMGKDDQGNAVVLHAQTGEVRSHGEFHAGYPLTDLPARLPAPLTF